ncbi:C2H2-type zinc finger transcription factor [Mucor lusitanicus CBS 277.49]|uniref:C2H2-type zinc finger transcription factor n=1 Tax=Mucor lusitanicus CBS 277.49 TaxID=747725 RepID=A0A168N301_MUCCL|nr:C2H2-type zinc finger transcription factor [Mucor lusitanicus CBS 277.49]
MLSLDDDQNAARIFACPQCPKIFATRSNLKRHMENPNIHNIPYVRSRDQKRWKGHSKKVVSKEETTERMRKWRAENREKNRQNDLRCRVYRLARQKYGDHDSAEKQAFVREEIARRLGRRMMMERRESNGSSSGGGWAPPLGMRDSLRLMSPVIHYSSSSPSSPTSPSSTASSTSDIIELPFYSAPQQKIELPSIDRFTRTNSWSSSPPDFSSASSSPVLPHLSPSLQRRTSSSSTSSVSSVTSDNQNNNKKRRRSSSHHSTTPVPTSKKQAMTASAVAQAPAAQFVKAEGKKAGEAAAAQDDFCVLPSMHAFLSYNASSSTSPAACTEQQQQQKQHQEHQEQCCIPTVTTKGGIKYVDSNKILDEFVGVVLNYVDNATVAQ